MLLDRADPLALMAFLFPAEMEKRLLLQIERETSGTMPLKDRAASIARLEREVEQLAYAEEALIAAALANGEDVQRSPSAPPQAVLGVRIVETVKSSRAA